MQINTKNKNNFLKKIKKTNKCWLWLGCTDKDGYGVFGIGGKNYRAHRVSYFIFNESEIQKGVLALHTCDNPSCVNPKHIVPGTSRDNVIDMIKKGRGVFVGSPKLSKDQVILIKKLYTENAGLLQREIGEMFGVNRKTISDIISGKSWKGTI
jgi:hypothetical protein